MASNQNLHSTHNAGRPRRERGTDLDAQLEVVRAAVLISVLVQQPLQQRRFRAQLGEAQRHLRCGGDSASNGAYG